MYGVQYFTPYNLTGYKKSKRVVSEMETIKNI